jgi:hypothetical protein
MGDSLFERLQSDMKAAMKARDKDRLGVLRMLISKVKSAAIDDPQATEDEGVTRVLLTYAKQREEGLEEARKAGRDELAEAEEFELSVVRSYLPEPLSDDELESLVETVIADEGASSMKDMGRVMKAAIARADGRADGGRVSAVVKKKLAG